MGKIFAKIIKRVCFGVAGLCFLVIDRNRNIKQCKFHVIKYLQERVTQKPQREKTFLSDFRKKGHLQPQKVSASIKIGVFFSLKVSEKGALLKVENTDGLQTMHWSGGTWLVPLSSGVTCPRLTVRISGVRPE